MPAQTPAQTGPQTPATTASTPPAPANTETALEPGANRHLRLKKGAFGREYLLSASVIPQLVAATGTALSGKIVRFERFHDGVDLYESTRGLMVTEELQSRRLLTTFPIVAQNEDWVEIDFNAGIRRVFSDKWYSSGESPNPSGPSAHRPSALSQPRSLEVPQSRIFEVRIEGRQIVLRQSAQVRDRQNDPNREERVEVRYFLTPYEATNFEPKEHTPDVFKHVRFFETQPQIEDTTGRISSRLALFDIRQPLLIHYSANTPEEHIEAVRDGILYWNRAFGREVVSAEKAPPGVTAPDSRLNLVQWVPWDSAGFAYADVMLDPRTGASLRGQAFLTSTFSFSGRGFARALLRNLRAQGAHRDGSGAPKTPASGHPEHAPLAPAAPGDLGLNWFGSSQTCQCDPVLFAENLATGLESILADPKLNDAVVRRISGDYIRETVAHEVGHILGLRHNFAGSLSATLTPRELQDWLNAYLTDDNTKQFEDRLTSSTVMDYNSFASRIFHGWKIRRSKEALPHDRAAIQWGYFASLEVAQKKMLFGTDQDIGTYADCTPFDYGSEPVVGAFAAMGEVLRLLPNTVIEEFIAAKTPRNPKDRRPLEQVSLDPDRAAQRLAEHYARMLSWFSASTRSLRIERRFEFVGPLNRKEVLYAHWKSLNEQLEKLGGVDRAFFSMFPIDWKLDLKNEPMGAEKIDRIDAKFLSSRLGQLLESPSYSEFTGLDEKPASFSKEEKALIQKRGQTYFEEFQKRVLKALCQRLERATRDLGVQAMEEVSDEDSISKLERRIIDLGREVILARNEEVRHRGKVDRSIVEVIAFRHDLETRLSAARMLSEGIGSFRGWATEARADIGKQLRESTEASLNLQHLRDFKEPMLSRTLRDWYLQQQNVLNALGTRGGPSSPPPAPPAPSKSSGSQQK